MAQSASRQREVHIRDVDRSDLALFFEHQLDREETRMAAFPAREWEAFLAHWEMILTDPGVDTQTIVVDGEVAGNLVSWEQEGHHEIGYWIGRDYWDHGIATEALGLFVGHLRARPLYAYVAVHNVGSMRVLEKCGFRRAAGQVASSSPVQGEERDEVDGSTAGKADEHVVFVLST